MKILLLLLTFIVSSFSASLNIAAAANTAMRLDLITGLPGLRPAGMKITYYLLLIRIDILMRYPRP